MGCSQLGLAILIGRGSVGCGQLGSAMRMLLERRLQNVFVIGKDDKPLISLPKGKGVRLDILQEQAKREVRSPSHCHQSSKMS